MIIDRDMLGDFRKDLDISFARLDKKYGIQLSIGRITFTPTSFRTRLEATTGEGIKEELTVSVVNMYQDLPIGSIVTIKSRQYKVIGYNPSAPKNNVKLSRLPDGRQFRAGYTMLRRYPIQLPVVK